MRFINSTVGIPSVKYPISEIVLSEFIRLAKSSEILWSDIFKSNLENIEEDTKAFIKNMHDLLEEASKNDSKSLLKKIQLIKKGVS